MPFDKIVAEAQPDLVESMLNSATTLAEGSNGLLQVYPPDRFEYQKVLHDKPHYYRIDGKPSDDTDFLDAIAATIDSRYKQLPAAIESYDQMTGAFTRMGEDLNAGQNVGLGMEHEELIDIALGLVAVSNKNKRMGIYHRSILVASKAIDYLGVNIEALALPPDITKDFLKSIDIDVEPDNTVPVRSFMSIANDATYLTVPDSKTFSDIRDKQRRAIGIFNGHVVRSLGEEVQKGGFGCPPILLGVALPGTTVKRLDVSSMTEEMKQTYGVEDGQEVDLIGRINPSVSRFMSGAMTYAIALRLNDGTPKVEVDQESVCLKSCQEIGTIAGKMVELAQKLEPGKRYIYDETGNLPALRKT